MKLIELLETIRWQAKVCLYDRGTQRVLMQDSCEKAWASVRGSKLADEEVRLVRELTDEEVAGIGVGIGIAIDTEN